jgi:hypothetical protein
MIDRKEAHKALYVKVVMIMMISQATWWIVTIYILQEHGPQGRTVYRITGSVTRYGIKKGA